LGNPKQTTEDHFLPYIIIILTKESKGQREIQQQEADRQLSTGTVL